MPKKDRSTAIHEAGHAVAHVRLGILQGRVTILPTDTTAGNVTAEGAGHVWDAAAAADQVIAYCAGYAALVAAGRDQETANAGADDDFDHAEGLIEFWGLEGDLDYWKGRAVDFMGGPQNIAAVKLVAEHLERERSLDEDVIDVLVDLSDGNTNQAQFDRYLLLKSGRRS